MHNLVYTFSYKIAIFLEITRLLQFLCVYGWINFKIIEFQMNG